MYESLISLTKKKLLLLLFFFLSVYAILQDVSVAETIIKWCTVNFQTTICKCFKNYGIPTRVNRIKVALKMSDPTSVKHSLSSPKRTQSIIEKSMQASQQARNKQTNKLPDKLQLLISHDP